MAKMCDTVIIFTYGTSISLNIMNTLVLVVLCWSHYTEYIAAVGFTVLVVRILTLVNCACPHGRRFNKIGNYVLRIFYSKWKRYNNVHCSQVVYYVYIV